MNCFSFLLIEVDRILMLFACGNFLFDSEFKSLPLSNNSKICKSILWILIDFVSFTTKKRHFNRPWITASLYKFGKIIVTICLSAQ